MSPIPYHAEDTWILVCNGGQAKFYVNHGPNEGVHEVDAIAQPVPPVGDLITGDRGRNQPPGHQRGNQAYQHADPRQQQKETFLKQVAYAVNNNISQIPRLVVIAPAKALHVLREELSPQVRKKIVSEIDKDLTKSNESNLPQFLAAHMNIATGSSHYDAFNDTLR